MGIPTAFDCVFSFPATFTAATTAGARTVLAMMRQSPRAGGVLVTERATSLLRRRWRNAKDPRRSEIRGSRNERSEIGSGLTMGVDRGVRRDVSPCLTQPHISWEKSGGAFAPPSCCPIWGRCFRRRSSPAESMGRGWSPHIFPATPQTLAKIEHLPRVAPSRKEMGKERWIAVGKGREGAAADRDGRRRQAMMERKEEATGGVDGGAIGSGMVRWARWVRR
ncbi:unnamed protein product [Urochloa humidicola]